MPDHVQLERFAYTPFGTFGRLYIPEYQCFTVERPWLNNEPKESCIPVGVYKMLLSFYNRGGYPAYELLDIPGRSLIKIHVGNTMDDLLGCIAPGKALGFIERKWAVTSSKKAFKEFMMAMDGSETSTLKIFNYSPGTQ
jgi:hypothetical protein